MGALNRNWLKWRYTIKIRDLLSNDSDQEGAHEVGKAMAERIKDFCKLNRIDPLADCQLDDIIDRFEMVSTLETWHHLCREDETWVDYPPIVEFNETLAEFYDWCDANKVWVKVENLGGTENAS